MDIGDRVKVYWKYYQEYETGRLDRYIESHGESGYWLVNDEGEEFEVLFQDIFRGEVTIQNT